MGKSVHNDVLDAALDVIVTCVRLAVCSTEPTSVTEALTTYALSTHTLTTGDFTIADGDASGRKVTVAQQASLPITATGVPQHVALLTTSILYLVTTCTGGALTSTDNTVTVPAFDAEIADPT